MAGNSGVGGGGGGPFRIWARWRSANMFAVSFTSGLGSPMQTHSLGNPTWARRLRSSSSHNTKLVVEAHLRVELHALVVLDGGHVGVALPQLEHRLDINRAIVVPKVLGRLERECWGQRQWAQGRYVPEHASEMERRGWPFFEGVGSDVENGVEFILRGQHCCTIARSRAGDLLLGLHCSNLVGVGQHTALPTACLPPAEET
ncbi:hypothetical protein C8R45DRAFT_1032838 [Mycena sanguinolenta]|nr:hypothetical protein C8R45DRAFT_1032838 [Mycena sanguinolenta]